MDKVAKCFNIADSAVDLSDCRILEPPNDVENDCSHPSLTFIKHVQPCANVNQKDIIKLLGACILKKQPHAPWENFHDVLKMYSGQSNQGIRKRTSNSPSRSRTRNDFFLPLLLIHNTNLNDSCRIQLPYNLTTQKNLAQKISKSNFQLLQNSEQKVRTKPGPVEGISIHLNPPNLQGFRSIPCHLPSFASVH